MAKTSEDRRGRPSNAVRASLVPFGKMHEKALLPAVVTALLNQEKDVIIRLHYLMKLPDGFPKGILMRREGDIDVRRIKAVKLLAWLRERGVTDINTEMIRRESIRLTLLTKEILDV